MITEDYVSFETAELLKEKRFSGDIFAYYNIWDKKVWSVNIYVHSEAPHLYIPAPTIQMAMKWLRNQHNLHIMVDCIGSKNYMPTIQFICNSKDIKVQSDENKIGGSGFDSFEEACETAIKYCLENLI